MIKKIEKLGVRTHQYMDVVGEVLAFNKRLKSVGRQVLAYLQGAYNIYSFGNTVARNPVDSILDGVSVQLNTDKRYVLLCLGAGFVPLTTFDRGKEPPPGAVFFYIPAAFREIAGE